jgi:acyl-CoA thioester hydrolase
MLPTSHEIEFRVRYQETDGQGRVHHANYFSWFETGRVELLRAGGWSYKKLEELGVMLVVADIHCRYFRPAEFDDLLRLATTTVRARGARIDQEYRVYRGDDLLAQAKSTVACIDRSGKLQRLPEWLVEQ